uniref:TOG domain-containing protein n=1 Tax=Romanomermis culicivorax TaxID=13658 RepID=A0A915I326_ROMCU
MWQNNLDENLIVDKLSDDQNMEQCLRILSKLKTLSINDRRWLEKFGRKYQLLDQLCKLLSSNEWELSRKSEANLNYLQKNLVHKMSNNAQNDDFLKSIPALFAAELRNSDWTLLKNGIQTLKDDQMRNYLFEKLNFYVGNLLDDFNIRVILGALEILNIVLHKLNHFCEPYVQQIIDILSKQFGNQKNQVRRLNLAVILKLAEIATPKRIVAALCSYLQHRSSRVKEEILNLITILMLNFDGDDENMFNFLAIMYVVCPLGVDSKRRVRLAALECLAVVANRLGYGKLEQVYQCARRIENMQNMTGFTKALEAKFNKKKLPKIRIDGLLEYSDLDFSVVNNDHPMQNDPNADMAWIMSAGLGPGSAAHPFRSSSPPNRILKPSPSFGSSEFKPDEKSVTSNNKLASASMDKSTSYSKQEAAQPNYELISAITGRNLLKIINNNNKEAKSRWDETSIKHNDNNQTMPADQGLNGDGNSKTIMKRHSSLGLASVQPNQNIKWKQFKECRKNY